MEGKGTRGAFFAKKSMRYCGSEQRGSLPLRTELML